MEKPIIFLIDDDPQVLRAVSRDLKSKYRSEYRIRFTDDPKDGLKSLTESKNKGEEVALFVADQRMPEMLGVDFIREAKIRYPNAKAILLTAYSDTDAAIRAINEVQLDYYLTKPWDPPEEKLFPVVDDMLRSWQVSFRPVFKGLKVLGYQYSPFSHDIKDFLSSNLLPYQWIDVESNKEADGLLASNNCNLEDLPIVITEKGEVISNPSISELAGKIGFSSKAKEELYDVAIIGAGPSGLAAAVYGGSEGLKTLLIEKKAPGGQAGSSSRIENYLGFPNGLSGQELTHRAITQAKRFGIEFLSPATVESINLKGHYKIITLDNGQSINCKSIVVSTGVAYRKLAVPGMEEFSGAGIYYGSSTAEAHSCTNKEVYIVGGGNSAGQAAVYLSRFAKNVYILIRREDLSSSMSSYLITQLEKLSNVKLLSHTEIRNAQGDGNLQYLLLHNNSSNEEKLVDADALFIFIGTKPLTDWLDSIHIIKNSKGFLETGKNLSSYDEFGNIWKLDREPYLLETCIPGVFASGDVRSGAMNRVASAVGEGSMAISFVHQYLSET